MGPWSITSAHQTCIHLTEVYNCNIYKDMNIGKKKIKAWSGWAIGNIKWYYLLICIILLEEQIQQKDKMWDEPWSRQRLDHQ